MNEIKKKRNAEMSQEDPNVWMTLLKWMKSDEM